MGTGTEVGKTWVSARVLAALAAAGVTVAARKPAQSFGPDDPAGDTDAAVLGRATGEAPDVVCPPARWYEVAMAPPMAAARLGRAPFSVADLAGELSWPDVDLGLVETAGGVRSPMAADGDAADLVAQLRPDLVVLVADAGLGTINAVRLSAAALGHATPVVVVLNRFDPSDPLHAENRAWLAGRDGFAVLTMPADEPALAAAVSGTPAPRG